MLKILFLALILVLGGPHKMAILLIPEPSNENPNTNDWQLLLSKLTRTTGGMHLMGITNPLDTNEPIIMAGSRFDINGSFFWCTGQEPITGTPVNNTTNFIYAVLENGYVHFEYRINIPVWNPLYGGYYDGLHRALFKFEYLSAGNLYRSKMALNYFNDLYYKLPFFDETLPTTGGTLILDASGTPTALNLQSIALQAGGYRFLVRGGNGGNGGNGGYNYSDNAYMRAIGYGGAGAAGQSISGVFYIKEPTTLQYSQGRGGGNGSTKNTTQNDCWFGGGGGGSGFTSFLSWNSIIYSALGGSGGGGGGACDPSGNVGSSRTIGCGSGGGGGGGFGIGGNGTYGKYMLVYDIIIQDTVPGGNGGNNFIGGSVLPGVYKKGSNASYVPTENTTAGGRGGDAGINNAENCYAYEYTNSIGYTHVYAVANRGTVPTKNNIYVPWTDYLFSAAGGGGGGGGIVHLDSSAHSATDYSGGQGGGSTDGVAANGVVQVWKTL
jgi:hypothetical protein